MKLSVGLTTKREFYSSGNSACFTFCFCDMQLCVGNDADELIVGYCLSFEILKFG